MKNPSAIAAAAVALVALVVFAASEDGASSLAVEGQSPHGQALAGAAQAEAAKDPAVSQLQAYARSVQGSAPVAAPAPSAIVADTGKPADGPMTKRSMGPAMPAGPLAEGTGQAKPLADVDTMIGRLAARMEKDPNNAEGWRMLGWSYFSTQNYPKAVEAYARAVALKPDSMAFKAAHAEAMVKAANDVVTPEAAAAFETILAAEPGNSRAIYFKGVAKEQSGDKKAALEYWTASLKAAATDVEWAADVKGRIEKLSREAGAAAAPQEPVKSAEPAKVPEEAPKQAEAAKEAPAPKEAVKAPEPETPAASQPAAAQEAAKPQEAAPAPSPAPAAPAASEPAAGK